MNLKEAKETVYFLKNTRNVENLDYYLGDEFLDKFSKLCDFVEEQYENSIENALQQFTGFMHNGDIESLIISMGLEKEEFASIQEDIKDIINEDDYNFLLKYFNI